MAVINTIDDVFTHPKAAADFGGARTHRVVGVISIAAADDDASIFFMAELPDTAIIDMIDLEAAAITGGTAYDVGIFDVDGTAILANVFANDLDMSSTTGLPAGRYASTFRRTALNNVTLANSQRKLYEHAGHVNKAFPASGETNRKGKYRIGLTGQTIGTAAGTILYEIGYRIADP